MQQGSGIILVLVGVLVLYVVVTGKYPIFEDFFRKLFSLSPATTNENSSYIGGTNGEVLPSTPPFSGSVSGDYQTMVDDVIRSTNKIIQDARKKK